MICCFFGHRDAPESIEAELETQILDLITNKSVTTFYVGNQGGFDAKVYHILRKIKKQYTNINYSIVLAYLPTPSTLYDYDETIYPEGLENVPPKYAISHRNRWMIDASDYAIVYVNRSFGGASQFAELAKRKGKIVINLAK